ncbi:hypothetical protein J7E73_01360 [Paenibacillus albidus]|uniref:hypothetical protein n=1 Tax=Paenibacillus albidus TaxID=2041023 RepID=UPI001BEA6533|nr:hypothetical protein [Paenibacillus albidus]MBT2287792.1 hypothetical protein [Paenibacillus albidus]
MRGKGTERWGTYEPFHLMLNNYRVANIVISNHAKSRYMDRISLDSSDAGEEIAAWMWQCLKQKRIKAYSHSEYNAYLIDDDLVMIAKFNKLEDEKSLSGQPLYSMIVVSFLGKVSLTPQLRELQSYYTWLRNSRRIKLMKRRRKRR